MVVKERESFFLVRFLIKSCKMRRLILLAGLLLCCISCLKIIHHRYYKGRGDGSSENVSNDMLGSGTGKNPKDLPGYFMRGKYPSENSTFCDFKYGLPHKLDWKTVTVTGTPQSGKKSEYRVIYNAIERTMYDKPYVLDQVTYATHVTPEFLYHIVEISRFWDGPISVAAFVPNYDLDITMRLFTQLCKCYEGMSKVSLHLVFPKYERPRFLKKDEQKITKSMKYRNKMRKFTNMTDKVVSTESPFESVEKVTIASVNKTVDSADVKQNDTVKNVTKLTDRDRSRLDMQRKKKELLLWFQDCSMPDMSNTKTYRSRNGLIYPVNVARNVARNASGTQYILVSDVEMIPSEGLATRFTLMVKSQKKHNYYGSTPKWKLAFVIPVFEVEAGEEVPRNKSR